MRAAPYDNLIWCISVIVGQRRIIWVLNLRLWFPSNDLYFIHVYWLNASNMSVPMKGFHQRRVGPFNDDLSRCRFGLRNHTQSSIIHIQMITYWNFCRIYILPSYFHLLQIYYTFSVPFRFRLPFYSSVSQLIYYESKDSYKDPINMALPLKSLRINHNKNICTCMKNRWNRGNQFIYLLFFSG